MSRTRIWASWARRAAQLALLAAGAAGVLSVWSLVKAGGASGVAPGLLTKADIGARYRVFATPGDYKLQNHDVTAVVRKRDGWITEFWRNRPILPSIDQLGTVTDIDGLWQFHPIVYLKDKAYPVMAERVVQAPDAIIVEGRAKVGAVVYLAVTRVTLDPTAPRLRLETTFRVEGGAASGKVGLGDFLRWGNVNYIVDGVRTPRMKYKGYARWIGRHGAGGDMLLKSDAGPMYLDYGARFRGFAGTIHALYARQGIPENGSVSVARSLSYESLPVAKPKPNANLVHLEISISDENSKRIAAKLRIERQGSKQPLFGDDGGLDGVDDFSWTGNGHYRGDLPPGRYNFLVTSGIEREAARFTLDLKAGRQSTHQVRLKRVIDTPGWVAADLHLHQAPSVDADIGLAERVVSIAAEGVEFAVATDHYVVTDLAPTVAWLRDRGVLSRPLITMPGCEVSTLGNRFGHFNVFPLPLGAVVESNGVTPSRLFRSARKHSPRGILQVNHPRWDPKLGYFSYHGIDDDSGAMSVAGYDPSYDTIEVYNGDDARDLKKVKRVLLDWIHLLGRGARYTATGSSDSHKLAFLDPGLPRTMIRYGSASGDDADVSAAPQAIIDALKRGRAVVSSGPWIEATVDGKGPGETASGVGAKAKLRVVVKAPSWVDVRSLEVLKGGKAERVHWLDIPRSTQVTRLDRTLEIPLSDASFVVVVVQGERGLPNAAQEGTQPFAFTNPIWLKP